MIVPGQKPDLGFRLKVVRGGVVQEVMFAELLTRRTIVSVYMKNSTPSCDRQNAALVASAEEFDRAGYNLVAISRDTCGSHLRYATAKKIGYTLVSDPSDAFARALDAVIQKSMYGRSFTGPARAAFVLDRDGTVLAITPKIDPAEHGAQLRVLINSL